MCNQSVSQSISQSINQPINQSRDWDFFWVSSQSYWSSEPSNHAKRHTLLLLSFCFLTGAFSSKPSRIPVDWRSSSTALADSRIPLCPDALVSRAACTHTRTLGCVVCINGWRVCDWARGGVSAADCGGCQPWQASKQKKTKGTKMN